MYLFKQISFKRKQYNVNIFLLIKLFLLKKIFKTSDPLHKKLNHNLYEQT